jgi:hypothetical protein
MQKKAANALSHPPPELSKVTKLLILIFMRFYHFENTVYHTVVGNVKMVAGFRHSLMAANLLACHEGSPINLYLRHKNQMQI